ncbi:serine endoprotease DegS [Erwinia amylovora]|uniref:Serine endoprotease DegS n=4 Tax=Erwinia amylovora TaxID=552 RepID=A0A831EQV3_ERWAM|nr:serine endoprotease DegS [Erwinia amylovora]EKV55156.1 serine protease [Erwinia amylovora ACW56400]CBA19241.1 serine protease [Erwinia amylovora CFBP1430]CBX79115.1 serine protease [Erwinia amylovora ATCC BAA-2158]CCO77150.1 serine protease [Erwinia amylovora Ea356]CCO80932.1 serine protease [Erwinia amylovora Ea266]CCO84737.1 serine protease [Erwinia amylovora CFBP 2585]CCO88525.1 serine protease [Erwinia amylovora 01SFR-BO]CCO92280.1 serine protease [Erwinia amylovora NBRC 12687 = CFBP
MLFCPHHHSSFKSMLPKLIRSAIFGLIIAAILLLAVPGLRLGSDLLSPTDDSSSQQPVSYNAGVRRAAPAVVYVYNHSANGASDILGSGVIMDPRGYILTNKHVINDASQIVVNLQDGRSFEAMLVGSDYLTDLAVLKINAASLPVIPINPQRIAHIGDLVMAIGNPYNIGQTVTQGIIGATGRVGLSPSRHQDFLQTDASINRGNSGGALINSLGELMGINTLSFDKSSNGETPEGLGFAIPTKLATKVMEKLIRDGRVIRGYIGITGQEFRRFSGPDNVMEHPQGQGIVVTEIRPGGPAFTAGMQVNDVITRVNGAAAVSPLETMDQVAEIRPGTVINVEVSRNEKKLTLPVTVQEYPEENQSR